MSFTVSLVGSAKRSLIAASHLADCLSRGGREAMAAMNAGGLEVIIVMLTDISASE